MAKILLDNKKKVYISSINTIVMISLNAEIAEHKKASPHGDMPDPFNLVISQSSFPQIGRAHV